MKSSDRVSFVAAHLAADYASEVGSNARLFTDSISADSQPGKRPLAPPPAPSGYARASYFRGSGSELAGLDAYSRHKKFINDYVISYGKQRVERYLAQAKQAEVVGKTDIDVLREHHKFIREGDDDLSNWEVRMAVKYYNKLFKEYCIADMSRYREGKFGLRWRTQDEVFKGKGQFICGNVTCQSMEDMQSFEMNFAYKEDGEQKNALVKLRVCPDCALKLNFRKLKEREKELKMERKLRKETEKEERRKARKAAKRKRKRMESSREGKEAGQDEDEEEEGLWEQVQSKSTGKTYWYNAATGKTQWEEPASVRAEQQRAAGEDSDSESEGEEDGDKGEEAEHGAGGREEGGAAQAEGEEEEEPGAGKVEVLQGGAEVWKRKATELEETAVDEFDAYFQGLFP